jgi:hypothetical protein
MRKGFNVHTMVLLPQAQSQTRLRRESDALPAKRSYKLRSRLLLARRERAKDLSAVQQHVTMEMIVRVLMTPVSTSSAALASLVWTLSSGAMLTRAPAGSTSDWCDQLTPHLAPQTNH